MVDTKAVAQQLGTDAKILRRFLRSSCQPVQPVGSGGRYRFTQTDLPALKQLFEEWSKGKNVRPSAPKSRPPENDQIVRDRVVWEKEKPVFLDDIRNPRVRALVREKARAQEARLDARLLARGLHITQWRTRHV